MIVRRLDEVTHTEHDVEGPTFRSRRLLLARDGAGFSLHDTVLRAGSETRLWYRNHIEAVYCLEGEGEIEDLESGETHDVRPGTCYALNGHERHLVRARSDMRVLCVFNPALTGPERHDAEGSYPAAGRAVNVCAGSVPACPAGTCGLCSPTPASPPPLPRLRGCNAPAPG